MGVTSTAAHARGGAHAPSGVGHTALDVGAA